ncbi:uncharacterized protein ACRADG_001927 isoform 2-T2 [Cochliomyia hominivorax]
MQTVQTTICDIENVSEMGKKKTNGKNKNDQIIININEDVSRELTMAQTRFEYDDNSKDFYSDYPRTSSGNEDNCSEKVLYIDIEITEKSLISAIWGLMLDEGITPPLFNSKNMQNLLQPICQAISQEADKEFKIDEAESERILSLAANNLRQDFISNLQWRLLSLKIDMDLNGPEKTFCVSTFYIQDGKMFNRFLGVIDFKDDDQLTDQHIKEILDKFNIDCNQIINIYCDFSKPKFYNEVKNSEYLKEIENFEYFPDIHFGDIKIERYVGVIAQLCLLDIFKNTDLFQNFLICRNFCKYVSEPSNGFNEIFEQNFFNIPELDSPWKWGSTYKMMRDLLLARNLLNDLEIPKIENIEHQFKVDDNLWLFIEAFCESLNYLQKSIIKFYNEEMHIGDFYAQWLKSKLMTTRLLTTEDKINNHYKTSILKGLLDSIETRSKDFLNKNYFQACLYMDPRFHHTLTNENKTFAVEYLKKLWNHSKVFNPDVINIATYSKDETSTSQSFNDEEDAILNEFLSKDVQQLDIRTTDVYNKIERLKLPFNPVDTDVLLFWQNLKTKEPDLYELSVICFAIPTTQIYYKSRYAHIYKRENFSKISELTRDNLVGISLNSNLLLNDALRAPPNLSPKPIIQNVCNNEVTLETL